MTKQEAVKALMSCFPRDFRRSSKAKTTEDFFNKVLESKSYIWPDARIIVEHSNSNDYRIKRF